MKARPFLIAISILCLSLSTFCSDDDPTKPKPVDDNTPTWPDLLQKDDVFKYLEMVYRNKDIERYSLLLDDDFIFWFSATDYANGDTPEQWGRVEELTAARNMFNGLAHPRYGSVGEIELEITPEGLWIEIPRTEPPYAGETWYQKTAEYSLTMETTSQYRLQSREKKALFTIRQAEVEGENIYRIVLWHDDIQ